MRIEKCFFCSRSVYPGHGTVFARNDGSIFRFCGSKCSRSFKNKRNPRRVRWTQSYRRVHGKDLVKDSVLSFEKVRNAPVVYDRELYTKVIENIPAVSEIRHRRESFYIRNRVLTAQEQSKEGERLFIRKNVSVLTDEQKKMEGEEKRRRKEGTEREFA